MLAQTEHSFVYLVKHKILDVLRIAKLVMKCTPDYERILREADFIKNLRHPGIPLVYDIIEDSDSICIIEEFISGKSLTEYVQEKKRLKFAEILLFTEQICKILEYLHNLDCGGIIHLDLKPDNILIDAHNNIRIIDFDNALRKGESSRNLYGSIGFAAPEQYHRLRPDCRADIYSLGMLILYMDCGSIQSCAEKLHHKQLYPVIKKCIHHNPLQRYRNVTAVWKDICDVTCKNNLKKGEADKSQKIYIYGTRRGIGTTHICLCIAAFLTRRGYQTVCVEQADSEDIFSEAKKGQLQKNGTFLWKGVSICPEYQGMIIADLSEYDYIVMDCGVCAELPLESNIKVAVTEFGYRERQEMQEICNTNEKCLIFVNHTDGEAFYEKLKKAKTDRKYYRIPCVYDWWKGNEMLSTVLEEAMAEGFPENFRVHKKGGGVIDWAKNIRKRLQKKCRNILSEEKCLD